MAIYAAAYIPMVKSEEKGRKKLHVPYAPLRASHWPGSTWCGVCALGKKDPYAV